MTDFPIEVQHGRMTLRFPAGTPSAAIDKRLKAIDRASKESPTPKRPSLPKLTRCKVPTQEMMDAAGTIVPEDGYIDKHTQKVAKYAAPGRPLVVMPEEMLKAGLLAIAHRTLKKWEAENPPEYAKWMAARDNGLLASKSTESIEKVVASILRPGGRVVSGRFAASLVWGLEELERRSKGQACDCAGFCDCEVAA